MTTTIDIPTLRTERLVLRAPRPEDAAPFATFYASDAARFVGGPKPDWAAWRYLCEVVGHWSMRGYGRWIVTTRDDDAAIGLVGLHFPPDWPEPELGWMLWGGPRGTGVATEAARAGRDWAYGKAGLGPFVSLINRDNAPSLALAGRLGATWEWDYDHPTFGAMQVWRHPGPEALAA